MPKIGEPVLVGLESTPVTPEHSHRRYMLLVNDGDKWVYIMFGSPAEMHTGVCLAPHGGGYELADVFGNLDTRGVWAIGASRLLVTEYP